MKLRYLSLLFLGMQIFAQESLFYTIKQGRNFDLKNILQKNSESIQLNEEGQTVLHVAVLADNWQALKFILNSSFVDINKLDKYGKTAMDYAVEYGRSKMIKRLYKNHGKVTASDNAEYAKKIITRPYRITFFIGLSIFSSIFILCPFVNFHSLMGAFIFGGIICYSAIPMIIGSAGWAYRSKNILLS